MPDRPNRAGETPYSVDSSSQKPILGSVFGARRLNTHEDSENLLGYDLYSSALADMLTEPTLAMPITVIAPGVKRMTVKCKRNLV